MACVSEPREIYPTEGEILDKQPTCCDICRQSFSNSSSLRLHRVKSHRQIENKGDLNLSQPLQAKKTAPEEVTFFHCPNGLCLERRVKFNSFRNLKQHFMRKHTEKSIQCACGVQFALEKDLLYHRKARCTQRSDQDKAAARLKKKKTAHQPQETEPVLSGDGSPIILIIPSVKNVEEVVKQIANVLKTTATVGIQASFPPSEMPSTSSIAVGENTLPQATEYSDFSNQFPTSMVQNEYFYQENNPEVRHISIGTDFVVPPYLDYPTQMGNYEAYEEFDRNQVNITFPPETPMRRNFGTTMDDFVTREPGDFDMFRHIETQTMSEAYWTEGNNGIPS